MKRKSILFLVVVLAMSVGIIFADTPNETLSEISGLTEDELYQLHLEGYRYGEIADQLDVLDAFREANIEERTEAIQALVDEGQLTQEEADTWIQNLGLYCDPSNPGLLNGNRMGYGFNKNEAGRTYGNGMGFGSCGLGNFGRGFGRN